MTNLKPIKKALISSIVALAFCFTMLLGTTFAWFTDSAATEGNIIKAGNLDITMQWADGKEAPEAAAWKDASEGPIFFNELWEPGYAEARHIKIANVGNLALNYKLHITANGEVSKLAEVIDVYYYDNRNAGGMKQVVDRDVSALEYLGTLKEWISIGIANGSLEAGDEYTATLVFKMRESAGNEYKNLSIGSDFSIQVLATQKSFESDGFGKDYDEFAGKTPVTPDNAQTAIHAAQEGDIIYLKDGFYDTLVIENADGTPKKGITIEHSGTINGVSFSVGAINLNSSENITIDGIYFDMTKAQPVYGRNGITEYVASIIGAKDGAAVGAKNIVIDGCKFDATSKAPEKYAAICFEEQGRPTSRATNITVVDCIVDREVFNFVRMNYMSQGTIIIKGNNITEGTQHNAMNFTGNAADLIVSDNVFGISIMGIINNDGWNPDKAMLGSSRQGTNHITIQVVNNTFINDRGLGAEGHVIDLKSSYTTDNCTLVFEGNTFSGGLAGMSESTVPCIWH